MSGTSLDGIDAALVRLRPSGASYRIDVLNFVTHPFDEELLQQLRRSLPPNGGSLEETARLHHALGLAFANAAVEAQGDMPLDYVASHGQTLYHDGNAAVTLQLGDPFLIRERTNCTVCYDFRSADTAAGGQGAPLVPYVDALLFGDAQEARVAVNIGGIANVTFIPAGAAPQDVTAFDSGPGNMLIDAFVRQRSGESLRYDRDGALGLRGSADESALTAMLADSYFAQRPPKSTGRERFGGQFLTQHREALSHLSLEDGCATLAAFTARSLADAIGALAPVGSRVLVSGGGAHNAAIMEFLQRALPACAVERSQALGVNGDAKEALAFAVLGYELLRERAANVPRVTGARSAELLGAIAPHDLLSLLAKVQSECRTS